MSKFPDRAESLENNFPRELEVNEAIFRQYIEKILREVMPGYILPLRGKKPAQPDHLTYSNPYVVINQWVGLRGFDNNPPVGLTMDSLSILDCINALATNDLRIEYRLIAAGMALNDKSTHDYLELQNANATPNVIRVAKQKLIRSCYLLEKLLTRNGLDLVSQKLTTFASVEIEEMTFRELQSLIESQLDFLTIPNARALDNPTDFPSDGIINAQLPPGRIQEAMGELRPEYFHIVVEILEVLLFNTFQPGSARVTDGQVQKICQKFLTDYDIVTRKQIAGIITQVISNPHFTTIFAPGSIKVTAAQTFQS